MALPLLRGAFRAAVRLVAQRTVVYPRCFQVGCVGRSWICGHPPASRGLMPSPAGISARGA